ncbi:hypothetical protein [Ensifer sp. B1-9]|uniref:hypothetical protein n=1 Tax=Ensifer sp. B1-9 TaxID=3141455 RepID=UPI003D19B862
MAMDTARRSSAIVQNGSQVTPRRMPDVLPRTPRYRTPQTPVALIHMRDIVAARFVLPKIHAQTDKAVHSRNQAVAQAETGSTENVDLGQVGPENG